MTRNKKRVLKRKQIRKQIKKNTNNKPSSEQQSRQNEMLKVMLSRPQQIIPGQTQANDKIQEKLDAMNKAYATKMSELEANKNKVDSANELNKVRTDITNLDGQIRQSKRTLDAQKAIIDKNTLYNERMKKDEENKILESEIQANIALMKRPDFAKPIEGLITAKTMNKKLKLDLQHQEALRKEQEAIVETQTQMEVNKRVINDMNAGTKIPIMRTKKGHENEQKKRTNGELMWKMDENGNYEYDYSKSKLKVQAKELADKRTELNERKIELEATQSQIESFNNIQKSLNQTKNDIDITTVELAAMKGYIDSSDYKRKLEDIQAQKQLVEAAKKKQEGEKFVYESKKKMAEIQAAGTVAYNFDPENLSPEANQAQLKTYTDLYMKALSTNLNAVQDLINANAERAAKLDTVMAKYNEIIERYPEDQRERVGNNISKLIYEKTEHQLPQNLGDFDTHNLNTANDFLNVIGSYAHEMLITPSQRDLFMNSEVFKNFKWDTTGHDLGSVFNPANSDE